MTDHRTVAPQDLEDRLREYVAGIDEFEVASIIADRAGIDPRAAADQLRRYVNESYIALELVIDELRSGMRILEIGSGIGLFSAFLSSVGFDIVELEPVGGGFEFIGAARETLSGRTKALHLDIGVDDLTPDQHGRFDLVYSLNVLEHVPDWRHGLDAAYSVLAPSGRMIQSCPNYSVPYEPHFGIPLVPLRPGTTERLLPARITETELWKSLNWITAGGVRRWARQRGATIRFERSTLADALDRLATDPEFGKRHGRIGGIASIVARWTWLRGAIRRAPVGMLTPMVFTVTRPIDE